MSGQATQVQRLEIMVESGLRRVRLDDYLFARFGSLSRMYLRDLVRTNQVQVNGNYPNIGTKVRTNDFIEIAVDMSRGTSMQPEDIPLNIIYEDDPDAPFGPFPDWWRNPFPRNPIDSGAIVVGAGIPPGTAKPDRSRLRESNYGSMVDAQGWGDNVVSCGYGGLSENDADEDRWYTSRFNGTSSAAAMVAGVVGCIQGASKAVNNVLDPATVRAALRDDNLNSPQTDGPFGTASVVRIGPRPNLCKLIDHLIPTTGIISKLESSLRRLLIK